MTATDRVRLEHDGTICDVIPNLGGAILALSVDGFDLLRVSTSPVTEVRDTACFLMLPYANRVADGRLQMGGECIDIGVDPAGSPHALHGHGWQNRWTLVACERDRAVMEFSYPGDEWPWPYRARQTICVQPDGVRIEVTLENQHVTLKMPAGVGLHPYFDRRPSSVLHLTSQCRWLTDSTGLSIKPVIDSRFDGGRECAFENLIGLDHFFMTSNDRAVVDRAIELRGSSIAGYHVYAPPQNDFFCVEPVSHTPNSFGRGEYSASDLIEPGGCRSWTFTLRLIAEGYRSTSRPAPQ